MAAVMACRMNIVVRNKCERLLRDPCECQAELGDIARITEVSFVSSFKFFMYWAAIVGKDNRGNSDFFVMLITRFVNSSIAKTILVNE